MKWKYTIGLAVSLFVVGFILAGVGADNVGVALVFFSPVSILVFRYMLPRIIKMGPTLSSQKTKEQNTFKNMPERVNYNPKNYSFKKLFLFWLPIAFLICISGSLAYIFHFGEVSYLGSAFALFQGTVWLKLILISSAMVQYGGSGLNMFVFICALISFLIGEIFSIVRLIRLRKIEQSGISKMFLRFLVAQGLGVGVLILSFVVIYGASFGISFAYGYGDLKLNLKEALMGVITDDAEIIRLIQKSPAVIEIYDAAGSDGAVLAKRDLRRKDRLTPYEGTMLPLLVKFMEKDAQGRSFFVPETNSVVYTNFTKDKTDKIIVELAFNHLRHNANPMVAAAFEHIKKPAVAYLDDQAYAPFLRKKELEDSAKIISSNEKIVAECNTTVASNARLISGQENDYQKNCVAKRKYSNCDEFRQRIEDNKRTSQKAVNSCRENQDALNAQYKDREKELSNPDVLEKNKRELSIGLYYFDAQTVYMRVIPDQDAFVYLHTLLHELFHHYSKSGSELPAFINEGITDYVTYKSFQLTDYEIADSTGYFKEVQAVMALLEKIPESELLTAYFSNNATMLKASFQKYFPKADYAKFLEKGDNIFRETYQAGHAVNLGFWDTNIDPPSVRDLRDFLGLKPAKFSENLY